MTTRHIFESGEIDPGCSSCGTCINHDGCADEQNPLADGDCPECGACAACIDLCATEHPT